jgi:GT2 family glycosyltransferase
VLVTVTYGDRIKYLSQLLDRALGEEGVCRAVVVSNAAILDISQIEAKWRNRVLIVNLNSNTGSANGYAVGIEAALALEAEYLWLMDDDNAPAKGTTRILCKELVDLSNAIGTGRAAVLGLRKSRLKDFGDLRRAFQPSSNFLGFHVAQIPHKIMRRLSQPHLNYDVLSAPIDIPYSPYGGLLAHRDVFKFIGLPRREFVLYADDWEYTMRLTRSGGIIRLVPDACIEDLESSWHQNREQESIFYRCLNLGSDFQIYYSFRNHVWINRNIQCASEIIYQVNKFTFLSVLSAFAVMLRKQPRFHLIRRAISDGERGSLGINANYPLPA